MENFPDRPYVSKRLEGWEADATQPFFYSKPREYKLWAGSARTMFSRSGSVNMLAS